LRGRVAGDELAAAVHARVVLEAGGEGFLAMSLTGHTGEGFTNPATFVKKRRVALAGALGTGGLI